MIEIKICGITNKKEIEYLNILKPEYIGFVFTKSKRQITGKEANELRLILNKSIKMVGVFKDNSIDEILEVLEKIPLDIIQLHGKEDIEFVGELKQNLNKDIKIWKALSVTDVENIKKYFTNDIMNFDESNNYVRYIDNFLIDGDNPGSGEAFSLENIIDLFIEESQIQTIDNKNFKRNKFFLAGGITAENVTERIIKVKPNGVDVSSGVEIIDENGNRTKSFEKMKSLIEKVRVIGI